MPYARVPKLLLAASHAAQRGANNKYKALNLRISIPHDKSLSSPQNAKKLRLSTINSELSDCM